ncbi:energy-coupling factor transporter transmembrane protein EcfT [Olsenella sp. DSM 107455]|uniref:Energy-coupling factor transporter transmembrane protein EcfT n=1 Tax=Thermophilibacter gallinarum TaxID=2779357 RepID=A0ABR9QSN2_9ACTN|nr:energy-coupling factor transporter transmembrane protein EcfT [Thermophilibacter gallinarum]
MRSASAYVWADSPLHRMPASAKLAGFATAVVLVVLASTPGQLAMATAAVAALVAVSRVGWTRAGHALWGLRWFLLAVLALNAVFFSSAEPVLELGLARLTWEGVAQGVRVVVRTALVVVLGSLLTATTRPQQITDGVRTLLRPLAHLGVPTETAALAVGVTMQFVPTLLRESRLLARAQAIRCGDFAARGVMQRAVSYVRLLVPVFVSAFRRADELSAAMEARGYRVSSRPACPRERKRP